MSSRRDTRSIFLNPISDIARMTPSRLSEFILDLISTAETTASSSKSSQADKAISIIDFVRSTAADITTC